MMRAGEYHFLDYLRMSAAETRLADCSFHSVKGLRSFLRLAGTSIPTPKDWNSCRLGQARENALHGRVSEGAMLQGPAQIHA